MARWTEAEVEAGVLLALSTTYQHAADVTGIPIGTLKARVHRQRKGATVDKSLAPEPPDPEHRQRPPEAVAPGAPTGRPVPPRAPELVPPEASRCEGDGAALAQALVRGDTLPAAAEGLGLRLSDASRLRRDPLVQETIRHLWLEEEAGPQEVRGRLSRHARASMADLLDLSDPLNPRFDLQRAAKTGALHAVRKLKIVTTEIPTGTITRVEVELYDAQAALDRLARMHGLYQDRLEITPGAAPITAWSEGEREAARQEGHERAGALRAQLAAPAPPGGDAP